MSSANVVEALLFVADAPATRSALADAANVSEAEIDRAIAELRQRLEGTALDIVEIAGGYQLCTREAFAEAIGNFLQPQRQKLSRSLMEVLAIVAYRQPVTQAEIDGVRGVQSDYGVRGLLERRLIQEVGRKDTPGRPVLYGTTQQFLHQFNLNALDQLPELREGASDDDMQPALPQGEPASTTFE
ncbi:MAG: SMC-Scp complex subunit ScpB [Fimbriimonadaceae bacterium]|nr:SMC-Scp complex subunit ScpB [Chthonomonadaceae bacterium]MCO5295977.1 SMC-Scp complex subunit ScpB [Fimbriimonadaceae bacterium]